MSNLTLLFIVLLDGTKNVVKLFLVKFIVIRIKAAQSVSLKFEQARRFRGWHAFSGMKVTYL